MASANRISVVIPAFNAEATIAETLDSVMAQTRPADEVVIVDDGSSDATVEVASAHCCRVRVIRQKNAGAAAALNRAIAHCQGEFIAPLDADDLWTPEKLALQEAALTSPDGAAIAFGHMEAFECPTHPKDAYRNLRYVKGRTPGYVSGTMLVRRSLLQSAGAVFDETLRTGHFIDWYRHQKLAGTTMVMLDELVLKRRIRPNTLSRRGANETSGLGKDFLEIARRAILESRKKAGNGG